MTVPDASHRPITDARAADRRDIRGLTLDELTGAITAAGAEPYRARQVMHWLHAKQVESFDAMHDLPASLRGWLADTFTIGSLATISIARSADGTRKLLLGLADADAIETVIIPASGRVTLCLSTQAGCAMGCKFCATARMGLHRSLTAAEIVGQIHAAARELAPGERLTNYVFMGMGEPLASYPRLLCALQIMTEPWGMNLSPRRITVSTVGIVPMMERLLADLPVQLAVSLHATTNELRDRLAPINRRYPLEVLLDACSKLPLARRRRITFEYVMLADVNDGAADARRLVKLLAPLRAKVNLILFNQFDGSGFGASSRARVEAFQAILQEGNLTATIRESRGQDIAAACGQLFAERRATRPEGDATRARADLAG